MKLKSQKAGFNSYYRNHSHLGRGCDFHKKPLRIKLSVNGTGEGWLSAFRNLALNLKDWFFLTFQAGGNHFGASNSWQLCFRERRTHPSLTLYVQLFVLERAAVWRKAVRRPFCFCKQNIGDNPLPRYMHIPREGTTFLFIHWGAVFAFKTAQTRPLAPEFCSFFPWFPGVKQVEKSALSMTCHEPAHLLVPALKK